MKLTLAKIKTLPIGKKISDGQGLCLTKTGLNKGRWEFRYMIQKRARIMALGTFPEISLAKARQYHFKQRLLLSEGLDPLEERTRQRDRKRRRTLRFSAVALQCIEKRKGNWSNAKHQHDWLSSLQRLAFPKLDEKPFSSLTRQDVIDVLEPIWCTRRDTAKKLQGRIKIVFGFAIMSGLYEGANPALWQDHLEHYFGKLPNTHKIQHLRSLYYSRMPMFYKRLQKQDSIVAKLLQFNILTVVRPSEARLAQVEEFDLKRGLWHVPWQRMKAREPHTVPLSDPAMEIIEKLRRQHNYQFVFHGRNPDSPLCNNAVLMFLKREYKDINSTVHGFRSSFRVWAAEEIPGSFEIAEKSLAHKTNRRVEGAYQRSTLEEPRRDLARQWADYLTKTSITADHHIVN